MKRSVNTNAHQQVMVQWTAILMGGTCFDLTFSQSLLQKNCL